ncbi:hypothetical protein [Terriglobus tenax]|uniref:hypothetical protein n=1 Tax=Terriglobus tenax TaxID=1111115 RepID=UPI0021E0717C|nr:hypothetical protein [Terriglobus tenax]
MEVSRIIAEIDAQISKLQQARALLAGAAAVGVRRPGRPKGSTTTASAPASRKRAKRVLSPEARKRIADAQKRRWAAHRKEGK